ncbi:CU044_5270 family protein [Nonomuraea indica]|uniref:CU044_5270 family protein n=1 Tax=Nonomuraea indica TaxID=1581193 RepID=UPI000C7A93C2|nr:CU044_5270 family protein [Nonomuraea indica]
MDDEIRAFADGRPAAPPYSQDARARARDRLLREARGHGGLRRPRLGWQAAAAFGITVTLVGGVAVALTGDRQGPDAATSVSQAGVSFPELDPKPGQFILVESDTMYGSHAIREGGETRHLYRTHRKIWQSVDGSADGLLLIEGREPKPYPGEKDLPQDAANWRGSSWTLLNSCSQPKGPYRDDFAYLSTLPTEPAAMRGHLYQGDPGPSPKGDADVRAFQDAVEILREGYLPKAQRAALYEAIKSIDGVVETPGVADSAGRRGVALGRTWAQTGLHEEIIFDPETRMMLGERATVADGRTAKAPVGAVVAHTAQLKVSVVDELPEAPAGTARSDCMPAPTESPTPPPTAPPSDAQATAPPSEAPASARPSTPLSDAPDAPRPTDAPAEGPADAPVEEPVEGPAEGPAGGSAQASGSPAPSAPSADVTDGPAPGAAPPGAPVS